MYEIRLCRIDEKELLKDFVRQYWSNDHIFLYSDDILDFQHREDSHYNFVVAYHSESSSFHAVLGFISPLFYSKGHIEPGDDLWLALWKVEKSLAETSSLGLDLLEFLDIQYTPRSISAIGIPDDVALLYKLLGFETGTMRHWFILNDINTTFSIAQVRTPLPTAKRGSEPSGVSIRKIQLDELDKLRQTDAHRNLPKSLPYLISRYLHHPIYDYEYYAITDANELLGYYVGRRIKVKSAECLRITDMRLRIDPQLSLRGVFQKSLVSENLEYLDLLAFGDMGFNPDSIGFSENDKNNFVPHLFEPFLPERHEVRLAYRSKTSFVCFKGDSDLDRPSIVCKGDH